MNDVLSDKPKPNPAPNLSEAVAQGRKLAVASSAGRCKRISICCAECDKEMATISMVSIWRLRLLELVPFMRWLLAPPHGQVEIKNAIICDDCVNQNHDQTTCTFCNGRGWANGNFGKNKTCIACDGTGHHVSVN